MYTGILFRESILCENRHFLPSNGGSLNSNRGVVSTGAGGGAGAGVGVISASATLAGLLSDIRSGDNDAVCMMSDV